MTVELLHDACIIFRWFKKGKLTFKNKYHPEIKETGALTIFFKEDLAEEIRKLAEKPRYLTYALLDYRNPHQLKFELSVLLLVWPQQLSLLDILTCNEIWIYSENTNGRHLWPSRIKGVFNISYITKYSLNYSFYIYIYIG